MFELKRISREGIDKALAKAERYRLLNEAWQAESICRDILALEPGHQEALVSLLLAITDQFKLEGGERVDAAVEIIPRLEGEYRQAYYTGIIWERRAMALLQRSRPGSGPLAYERLREAMAHYERAEALRPRGDDSAIVRWNSCARMIMRHDEVGPAPEDDFRPLLE
jgi:tetratricopeptide (TPR) repeat protein